MNRYFKVEGDIIYPDHTFLTWGPFYYHSKEKAIEKIDCIFSNIIDWCNLKEPILEITPRNVIRNKTQVVFSIMAWKDEETLQECNGIISVEEIFFEDELN